MTKTNMKEEQHEGGSGWVNFKKQGFQPSSDSQRPRLPEGGELTSGISRPRPQQSSTDSKRKSSED